MQKCAFKQISINYLRRWENIYLHPEKHLAARNQLGLSKAHQITYCKVKSYQSEQMRSEHGGIVQRVYHYFNGILQINKRYMKDREDYDNVCSSSTAVPSNKTILKTHLGTQQRHVGYSISLLLHTVAMCSTMGLFHVFLYNYTVRKRFPQMVC